MANQSTERNPPANLQRYGVPVYAAAWVPDDAVKTKILKDQEMSEDGESSRDYVVLAGGGGEGRNGIPNALIVCRVDPDANSLSEQPAAKLVIGSDLPYRMTVHPGGDSLVCALQNSCRQFGWEEIMSSGDNNGSKESENSIKELEDVGQQLSLVFNNEGTVLATGGEDGTLRVFNWPSMKPILNESKAHPSVKHLAFSLSGKYLVSLGATLCRVWDVSASTAIASLPKEKDEMFAFCKFSQDNAGNEVLYIASMTDRGGSIITWDTTTWKRKRVKVVTKDGITSFDVSVDGKVVAVGTNEGDVVIMKGESLRTTRLVKKAHMILVTALAFSPDSRCLVSASLDSSARLTVVEQSGEEEHDGHGWWVVLLVMLIAVLVYFLKASEFIR